MACIPRMHDRSRRRIARIPQRAGAARIKGATWPRLTIRGEGVELARRFSLLVFLGVPLFGQWFAVFQQAVVRLRLAQLLGVVVARPIAASVANSLRIDRR